MSELPKTLRIFEDGITQGLHTGGQLYVSLEGAKVCHRAIGQARQGEPMTTDHLMLWMSAGKPITALAIGQQIDRKTITLDTRIADVIPEFAANGKGEIRLRHLLSHTAGFRGPLNSFSPGDWDDLIHRACQLKIEPGWVPGEKAGYHVASSWFVLAEIVRRLDGRPIEQYVRDEIFLPLGQEDAWVGIPEERVMQYGNRIARAVETSRGWADDSLVYNELNAVVLPRPAANARGPIRSLGRIYECLLAGGAPIVSPQIARSFTSRQRHGLLDHTFKVVLDWGFGFMIDSKQYAGPHAYGYGDHAGPDTFGHSGNQCSCAFAEARHGLVVAWACNGLPGEPAHQSRQRAINTTIYEELGLM